MRSESYPRFLSDCTVKSPEQQAGLRDDELWGVYLSWCALNDEQPGEEQAFWRAMTGLGCFASGQDDGYRVWRGLVMTGPAVVDYILSSRPSLV